MERDLNLKRLVRMFISNIWILIIAGVIGAVIVNFLADGFSSSQNVITKQVFLVYDLESTEKEDVAVKKNTYFDAYKALLAGNTLIASETFDDEERSRLQNIESTVEYSCYTITLTVPDDGRIEEDKASLNKVIAESERWMQEKFQDDSIQIEVLNDSAVTSGGSSTVLKTLIGLVLGAILAAVVLFIMFVMDKKIRTEEDVLYYTGVECIGTVRRRKR